MTKEQKKIFKKHYDVIMDNRKGMFICYSSCNEDRKHIYSAEIDLINWIIMRMDKLYEELNAK